METDMGKLTQSSLARLLAKPGRHNDGGGLYFRTMGLDRAYWTFRYRSAATGHKDRELSIGPYPEITLLEARSRHAKLRRQVKEDKLDPLAEKRAAKTVAPRVAAPTFGEIADQYVETHSSSWRSPKHRWQWSHTLTFYCAPIRDLPVDQVDTAAVLKVLQPLWSVKQETAARLRGRIEAVLDAARALGHIDADKANPARWKGHLDKLLPKRKKLTRGHHPAVPYADIPALMAKLKRSPGTAAKTLMFTILTASRTGEALGATWDEIDLDAAVWTVPAERMKMQKQHRVPLSDAALAILKAQAKARGKKQSFVFESPVAAGSKVHRDGAHQPLSSMAMRMVLRRLKLGEYTIHGFRSSFRDWAGEETHFPREVCEAALAHVVGGVEGAYRRGDALEKRRELMAAWASYCIPTEAKVVSIAGRRKR
jgi:integrase